MGYPVGTRIKSNNCGARIVLYKAPHSELMKMHAYTVYSNHVIYPYDWGLNMSDGSTHGW